MQQNRALFFGIIGVALLAVVAMFLARFFIPEIGPGHVTIQVVAAPSIKPWVEEAAQQFNQENGRIVVQVLTPNNLVPTGQFASGSNPQAVPPAAWLAEATFVVEMARADDYAFADSQSVAATSLAWGGFEDNLAQFEQTYGPLSWAAVHEKAVNPTSGRFLKFVMAAPDNRAEGLGVLISATAAQVGKQSLTASDVSQANSWLRETFGENVNRQVQATPAEAFAVSTGRSIGDFGVLSMASWQRVRLPADFTIRPLEPTVSLDFPFAIYTDGRSPAENQEAARAFRDFLLSETQQNRLASVYLDRAATAASSGVQIDGAGAKRLFDSLNQILR